MSMYIKILSTVEHLFKNKTKKFKLQKENVCLLLVQMEEKGILIKSSKLCNMMVKNS